jgi:uncharacterized membrane protein
MFITSLIPFFIPANTSMFTIYVMIHLFAMIAIIYWPYVKANQAVRLLKKEKSWVVPAASETVIDTKATVSIYNKLISAKEFILPLLIAVISFLPYYFWPENAFLYPVWIKSLVSPFLLLLFYGLFLWIKNMPNKVYSPDSEENMQNNITRKNNFGLLLLISAYYIVLLDTAMTLCIVGAASSSMLLMTIFFATGALITALFYMVYKFRRFNRSLTHSPITLEDDQNWLLGAFYYNKNDNSILVESPSFPINLTVNLAKPVAKVIVILTAAILIWTFWLLADTGIEESASHTMIVTQREVVMQSYKYKYTIPLADITDILLLDDLPNASRTNGFSTDEINRGKFAVRGYGESFMLIYKDNPWFMVIKAGDTHYFFNAPTLQETDGLYRLISSKIE